MLKGMLSRLFQDGITIKVTAEISIEPKQDTKKRYTAECVHCGWSNDYAYPSGATRALQQHLETCEAKPIDKPSPNRVTEIPSWLEPDDSQDYHDDNNDNA